MDECIRYQRENTSADRFKRLPFYRVGQLVEVGGDNAVEVSVACRKEKGQGRFDKKKKKSKPFQRG